MTLDESIVLIKECMGSILMNVDKVSADKSVSRQVRTNMNKCINLCKEFKRLSVLHDKNNK